MEFSRPGKSPSGRFELGGEDPIYRLAAPCMATSVHTNC